MWRRFFFAKKQSVILQNGKNSKEHNNKSKPIQKSNFTILRAPTFGNQKF